jgi:hypothetical protein
MYDDDYETSNKSENGSSSSHEITMTSNNEGNTPRFLGNNYRISNTGSGGGSTTGGGSKHRCPKCGAFVTFQETTATNRIQNCFYCAACSGWFLVQPEQHAGSEEHSKYLLGKLGEQKQEGVPIKRGEMPFVMQDVSVVML